MPVNSENKIRYIYALANYRLNGSIKNQTEAFLEGFECCFPRTQLATFGSVLLCRASDRKSCR